MANAAIMQTGGFQLLLKALKGLRKGKFVICKENIHMYMHVYTHRIRVGEWK